MHNVSLGDPATAPDLFRAYKTWAAIDGTIAAEVARKGKDPRGVLAQMNGTCTAYPTLAAARGAVDASMKRHSKAGYWNIVTQWQPTSTAP